jgi:hypothetical protein
MSDGQDSKERGMLKVGEPSAPPDRRHLPSEVLGDAAAEGSVAGSSVDRGVALELELDPLGAGQPVAPQARRDAPDGLDGFDLHFEFALPLELEPSASPPASDPDDRRPSVEATPEVELSDGPSIEWSVAEEAQAGIELDGWEASASASSGSSSSDPPAPAPEATPESRSLRDADELASSAPRDGVERSEPASMAPPSEPQLAQVSKPSETPPVHARSVDDAPPSEPGRAVPDLGRVERAPVSSAPRRSETPSPSRPSVPMPEAMREGVAPRRRSVPAIAIPPPTPSGGVARARTLGSPSGPPTPSAGINRARIMGLAPQAVLPPSAPPTPAAGVSRPVTPLANIPAMRPSPLATPVVGLERRSRQLISPEQRRTDRIDRARACIAAGQFGEALDLVELIRAGGDEAAAAELEGECELVRRIADEGDPDPVLELGGIRAVLSVRADPASIRGMSLDHRAGFLLSMIDGILSVEDLCDMGHMPMGQTLTLLVELKRRGLIG